MREMNSQDKRPAAFSSRSLRLGHICHSSPVILFTFFSCSTLLVSPPSSCALTSQILFDRPDGHNLRLCLLYRAGYFARTRCIKSLWTVGCFYIKVDVLWDVTAAAVLCETYPIFLSVCICIFETFHRTEDSNSQSPVPSPDPDVNQTTCYMSKKNVLFLSIKHSFCKIQHISSFCWELAILAQDLDLTMATLTHSRCTRYAVNKWQMKIQVSYSVWRPYLFVPSFRQLYVGRRCHFSH